MSNNKDNSFRRAFYHLKMADEYFSDVIRGFPLTIGAKVSKKYLEKIKFIFRDFSTCIDFPQYANLQFLEEMKGDVLFHEKISQLSINLTDEQKSVLESMVELLIAGETLTYEIKKP